MITNISLTTVYCLDQDEARDFYVDVLGFELRTDATMGDSFRWVTVGHPSQPELEVTLMTPGPPLTPDAAEFVRRQLQKGEWGGFGMQVDDCRKTYAELTAAGRDVPAGTRRAPLRRRGRDARQLRQLAGARRTARVHPGPDGLSTTRSSAGAAAC